MRNIEKKVYPRLLVIFGMNILAAALGYALIATFHGSFSYLALVPVNIVGYFSIGVLMLCAFWLAQDVAQAYFGD